MIARVGKLVGQFDLEAGDVGGVDLSERGVALAVETARLSEPIAGLFVCADNPVHGHWALGLEGKKENRKKNGHWEFGVDGHGRFLGDAGDGCVGFSNIKEIFSQADSFSLSHLQEHEAIGERSVGAEDRLPEVSGVAACANVAELRAEAGAKAIDDVAVGAG